MMSKTPSRRYRPVYIICLVIACFGGLLTVTWGGGAVAASVEQMGKARATARVLEVEGNRSSGHITVEFTTRDGRRVETDDKRRGWPADAGPGDEVEVVYDPNDAAGSVQRFQDVRKALVVVPCFAIVAVLSGVAAYRTRPR
ncbi:DUF3592 domain-containing protein [Actinomadura sp. NPDC047616]|uniref:DUF3592 domain-containing protein n=1 Tax=Actinomadura sp. NPDC047616 TaxID=3155914 RepID=UPI0034107DDD